MPDIPPNEDLDPERQEPIFDYLRKHSGHDSLATLRGELLEYGYDRATVDRAIGVYRETNPPVPPRGPWPLWIAAFNFVLTIVLTMLLPSEEEYWVFGPAILAFLICFGELFIAFLMLIPRDTRPWIGVLLQGIGLFAGVGVIVLGGLCFVG